MTEIDAALRRAFMLVKPEYFSWPVDVQERYRVSMPDEDGFRLRQVLLRTILKIRVRNEKQLAAAVDAFDYSQSLAFNTAVLATRGIGDDYFFLN